MTTYTKLDAASHQLDKAINLFLEGDHLCAVTLSGAAEEILGKLSAAAGHDVAVEYIAALHGPEFAATGAPMTKTEIISALNRARNAAKHAGASEGEFAVDWADAMALLMRAIPMARELGVKTEQHQRFEKWREANAQMIDDYMK